MKEIILASTSPRRKELLKKLNIEFTIKSPNCDENLLNKKFSYSLIEELALKKGMSVKNSLQQPAIIISADTVVVYEDLILGKPKDFDEAYKMLSLLNGKTHKVVTSVCVIEDDKKIIKSDTSEVTFNLISKNDIQDYINKFSPYDKAGSYGIQELPANFIKEIKGEFDNIVGLPTKMLKTMLLEIKKI
jgi:septum formation protein